MTADRVAGAGVGDDWLSIADDLLLVAASGNACSTLRFKYEAISSTVAMTEHSNPG